SYYAARLVGLRCRDRLPMLPSGRRPRVALGLKVPSRYRTRPESSSTISDDTSTASKSAPLICLRSRRASSSQRSSGAPERNQEEPLSARIIPYVLRASATTLACSENPDVSKSGRRRNR